MVNSVPVGSLTFALKVTQEKAEAGIQLRGDRARRYTYAFLSYASADRAEVIKRAQGLKAGGTSFFNDLLSLEPGERWEKRLYKEIDRCDVFYLFWSSQAKASKWVMKEIERALDRRAKSENGDPDIIPIIIEGPPPPAPPNLSTTSTSTTAWLTCWRVLKGGLQRVRGKGDQRLPPRAARPIQSL